MNEGIREGSTVQFKSGGQVMTVEAIDSEGLATLVWSSKDGTLQRDFAKVLTLKLYHHPSERL